MDATDVLAVAEQNVQFLAPAVDADWGAPIPDMDWSVAQGIAHAAEAPLWYAFDLTAGGADLTMLELRVTPERDPATLVAALVTAARVLAAPSPDAGGFDPGGHAAIACDKLLIHTDDAGRGLGRVFKPAAAICARVLARLFPDAPRRHWPLGRDAVGEWPDRAARVATPYGLALDVRAAPAMMARALRWRDRCSSCARITKGYRRALPYAYGDDAHMQDAAACGCGAGAPRRSTRAQQGGVVVDFTIELVVVPVSDVDRAKTFSIEKAGFHLDVDHCAGGDFCGVQLTVLDPACSTTLLWNPAAAGSVQGLRLIVSDLEAARAELTRRGMDASAIFHFEAGSQVLGPDPRRSNYGSFHPAWAGPHHAHAETYPKVMEVRHDVSKHHNALQ